MSRKNIVVLGAGPGGYTAAFLAADLGMQVTLINTDPQPGGDCLHRGCIPSKALLHLSRLIHETRQAGEWGLIFGEPEIDLGKMRQWKNEVVKKMSGGLSMLCKQRRIRYINGKAMFCDSNTVVVSDKEKVSFDRCILATGARPVMPALFGNAGSRIIDSTGALELEEIPERLLIVGGGYIGLEMGTVYAALGSRVTVVEMTGGLLPGIDRDLVRPLQARLRKDFENIHLNTKVTSVEVEDSGVRVGGDSMNEIFDRVLVAVGREPNSNGIGLQTTGVELDANGFVRADPHHQTADPSIYAIGDVIGGAMLAHKASAEARVAVEAIHGQSAPPSRPVPAVVFTDPEIAWCGLTETEAAEKGVSIAVAKFPWGASGRAQTLGRPDGMTKLILDPGSERILGVAAVGSGVGELIAEGALAMQMGATARDLAQTIHPHPTLSETLMEAAEVFYGTASHIFKKRK